MLGALSESRYISPSRDELSPVRAEKLFRPKPTTAHHPIGKAVFQPARKEKRRTHKDSSEHHIKL